MALFGTALKLKFLLKAAWLKRMALHRNGGFQLRPSGRMTSWGVLNTGQVRSISLKSSLRALESTIAGRRFDGCWLILFWIMAAALLPAQGAAAQSNATAATNAAPILSGVNSAEKIILPVPVPDPIEPFNRVMWGLNRGVMTDVIKPTAKVYRAVVRKPVRRGIRNFGRNITYPDRLINNLLQTKWGGAKDETLRFLCNSVLGVGGFFDVATRLKIPTSDADFGQTFGKWGWKPHAFVMLPVYGPSNERDALGSAADTASNPLYHISPYTVEPHNPLTYASPYTYATYGIMYNNLTDSVDDYVRFARTQFDPYSEIAYAWGFVRQDKVIDFRPTGQPDPGTLETLQTVFFTYKDAHFPERGATRAVVIPTTARHLDYTSWMQPGTAPIVYILPGLGSHRLAETALALAEVVYDKGFSVVTISNPFNYEFMNRASTADVPAYTPADAGDVHVALTEIDQALRRQYPGRIGARALMGYSMGAFESLFIAAEPDNGQLVKFDRYLAISPPVRLTYAMSKLDEFYNAPLAWPASEREKNIENTFLKVAALAQNPFKPPTAGPLPFNAIESKFIIGVVFRFILRDVIFDSQQQHNMGVIQMPVHSLRRDPVYQEIMQFSYGDYFSKFVIPYYRGRGLDLANPQTMEKAGDLRSYGAALGANPDVHIIVNADDFLLADSDLEWLKTTFGSRLTAFQSGGHLGNLNHPEVQKAMLDALDGLGATPAQPTRK